MMTGVLQVLCSHVELEEYGEVIAVHDRVRRLGARRRKRRFFGGALDDVEWSFDRYAGLASEGAGAGVEDRPPPRRGGRRGPHRVARDAG
jgi:hypothetical protein